MADRVRAMTWPWRLLRYTVAAGLTLPAAACGEGAHAPSVPVFGSFFPLWLLASCLGVLGTVVLRLAFIRVGIDDHLPAPALVYLCAAILLSVAIWAVWSGEVLA